MARDADALLLLTKWANSGDVATPESVGIDRNDGYGSTYSQPGGQAPRRTVFNQILRELSGLAVEINTKGPFLDWDDGIDYTANAAVTGSDGTHYFATNASGPTTTPRDPTDSGNRPGFWQSLQEIIEGTATGGVATVGGDVVNNTDPANPVVNHALGVNYLHVQDQKASGTAGGTANAGINTRVLNTVLTNTIAGASLSSNQITLPAGTYYIKSAAPAYRVDQMRTFFYNVTDSTNQVQGPNAFADNADFSVTHAFMNGLFTIAETKVFEVRHQCQLSFSTNGFGWQSSTGDPEIYIDVEIWKVG